MPAPAHRSQVRGRNKFEPFKHPWMPRPAAPWSDAMSRVDLSRPARPSREIWGHWLPEPALLVGPKSDERRDKYFMSWLRLRPAWIYLLRQPRSRVTGVPTQWWRDILLGSNHKRAGTATATSERWEKIKLVFGDVFEEVRLQHQKMSPESERPSSYYDRKLIELSQYGRSLGLSAELV